MSVKGLLEVFRNYLTSRDEDVVQDWLERFDWKLSERDLRPNPLKATRHLPETELNAGKSESGLVRCLLDYSDKLNWIQSYSADDFGQYFVDNYAHVELIGTRGHFASIEIAAGLVLYGPQIDYPNHWHVAKEIYIPMTGIGMWSFDNQPYVRREAGEFIFHESNMPHAIKTENSPLLALWVWRGGDLTQKGNY